LWTTTKFIRGVGNPSTNAAWNRRKQNRSQVMREALATIGRRSELGIGTAYRRTTSRGAAYQAQREQVYDALVTRLDSRLGGSGITTRTAR
jgi:hypothetical protein